MPEETAADHMWLIEVLSDIEKYAAKHNLKRLHFMVEETHRIAREEAIVRNPPSNFDAVMAAVFPHFERKDV